MAQRKQVDLKATHEEITSAILAKKKLTHEEMVRLNKKNPKALFNKIYGDVKQFYFGVEEVNDLQYDGTIEDVEDFIFDIGRRVMVDFVPELRDYISSFDELPQFSVFPQDDRAGQDMIFTHSRNGFDILVFFVSQAEYDLLYEDLAMIASQYDGCDFIPDTWFEGTRVVKFIKNRVYVHPLVKKRLKMRPRCFAHI